MKKKELLLIIDLQKGWYHQDATAEAMLNTVELCKKFDGDMIHCRFRNDPNSLFYSQLEWYRFSEAEDTDEILEIEPFKLPTYWRSTYSCLTDEVTELVHQYDRVYIAGVFTDISVASTAMGLIDEGVPVSVVRDCVATLHGEDVHRVGLKSLEHAIGREYVLNAAEILASH